MEKVTLLGPDGDLVDVAADPEELTPYMVLGYIQAPPTAIKPGVAGVEEAPIER